MDALMNNDGLSVRTVQRVEAEGSGLPETRLALAAALGVAAAEWVRPPHRPSIGAPLSRRQTTD